MQKTNYKNFFRNLLIFSVGAIGYFLIEILYRGHSHWTMAVCGGICLLAICYTNRKLRSKNLFLRAAICAVIITVVEFICGCIVNLLFDLSVWDYSEVPYNLLGQICLLYSFIWFAISAVICALISIPQKIKRKARDIL